MDILDTLITRELGMISSANMPSPAHRWELTIKANGRAYKASYIRDVKLDRLYHKNYADELRITAGFAYGHYSDGILPYKAELEAELTLIPLAAGANPMVSEKGKNGVKKFKAQIVMPSSDAIAGDNPLNLSKGRANTGNLVDVEFQLISHVIDRLKKKTFGTVFRDTNPMDAIGYVLIKHSNDNGINDGITIGIEIDNTFKDMERSHIVLDHDTLVVAAPAQIDNQVGGLHPAQMKYFLQNSIWYIYPILDYMRWGSGAPALTIIKVPKSRLQNVDKSYRTEGNQVIILSTRGTTHQDGSESVQLNKGNGTRFADSRKIRNGFVQVGDNKAVVDATQNMTEVTNEARADGSDFITGGGVKLTDKYNKEYAKMAAASGSYIQTFWENSDPSLLTPGMPVRYLVQDGEETKELYGTLLAVEVLEYNTNNTISEPRFVTLANLTIFVNRRSPLEKNEDMSVSTSKST